MAGLGRSRRLLPMVAGGPSWNGPGDDLEAGVAAGGGR